MAIAIEPYTADLVPAVRLFNRRLEAGGAPEEFRFPEHPIPDWLPPGNGRTIYQQYFLAVEQDFVRGGYILKHQDFSLRGEIRSIAFYHSPLSEGIVNRTYAGVGAQLLRAALKASPRMFALGMGGFDRPLPRMLRAMGWSMHALPFYFKVNHPRHFLMELRALRTTGPRRFCTDVAAITGAGWMALKFLQKARGRPPERSLTPEAVSGFSSWADEVWCQSRTRYAMVGVRDAETLNLLYPSCRNFLRLRINRGKEVVGWAVVLDTRMHNNRHFGNLRVGSIVDCLAVPENAALVTWAAAKFLEDRGVDLIVTNQSEANWCAGLKTAGFFEGPSNFIFAASKQLSELLPPLDASQKQIHVNRGDGDGPIHL